MRIVSATPLNEPSYAAVAKYDNTSAWRRPSTTDGTRKVSLSATALSSPNLEVIGEHGNFYLVKVWSALDHPIPLHLTTAIKFVEKYNNSKIDPVEKQNISRVVWPVPNRLVPTSQWDYWGWRSSPTLPAQLRYHNGVDINAGLNYSGGETIDNTDIPIVAIMDGKVVSVQVWDGTLAAARGHAIILEHDVAGIGKYYTLYQHVRKKANESLPSVGTRLKAGDTLVFMGNTGNTTGPHLHFEMMRYTVSMTLVSVGSSTYSINPISTYCDRDKRDTRDKPNISAYNTEPFFKWDNSSNKYKFNRSFDWTYAQPDSNTAVTISQDKSPVKYSHNNYYKD